MRLLCLFSMNMGMSKGETIGLGMNLVKKIKFNGLKQKENDLLILLMALLHKYWRRMNVFGATFTNGLSFPFLQTYYT